MKKNLLYILAAGAMLFSSCDSQLDVAPAGTQVSDEQLQELIIDILLTSGILSEKVHAATKKIKEEQKQALLKLLN